MDSLILKLEERQCDNEGEKLVLREEYWRKRHAKALSLEGNRTSGIIGWKESHDYRKQLEDMQLGPEDIQPIFGCISYLKKRTGAKNIKELFSSLFREKYSSADVLSLGVAGWPRNKEFSADLNKLAIKNVLMAFYHSLCFHIAIYDLGRTISQYVPQILDIR